MIWLLAFVVIALLSSRVARDAGRGVNDLSRWKQYGGTLERPSPPGRFDRATKRGECGMKFILILFIYGFGGSTPAVVHSPYETRDACEVAGKAFDKTPSGFEGGPVRQHVCIPAPKDVAAAPPQSEDVA